MVHLAIVNLAGVPSVVYGLFGLGLFVLALRLGASILSASLLKDFARNTDDMSVAVCKINL
jgi:ABC-type phosphate transport system permease subunit